jgi:hypothetical protein
MAPLLEKAPEDPSDVNLIAPTSSEPGSEDQLLARLEYEGPAPAVDKKESFRVLQEHMNNLPTPDHNSPSLENAVALSALLSHWHYSVQGIQEVSDQLKDMARGMLQLIEDPAWNEKSLSDIQTKEVQQWYEDH